MTYNSLLPFVSVIVPTFHDWDRLQLCLDALNRQSYKKEMFEIIVVNNDPSDRCPGHIIFPENCYFIEESKPGSYAARNKALDIAKGEIYAFTDSDCQPQEDWLENSVSIFMENKEIYRIGGKVSLIFKGPHPTISELYEKAYAFRQVDFVESKGVAITANMVSRKEVFDSVGRFNGKLMSGGDAEWGERAQAHGFSIIYSDCCVVWHPTRSRLNEIIQKTKREAGGHFLLMAKGPKFKLVIMILLGVLPPGRSMLRVLRDDDLTLKEKLVSILIRYYLRLISLCEKLKLLMGLKGAERL